MKKEFRETLVAKVLKGLLTGIAKNTPIIGDVVENVVSKDGGPGKIDYRKLVNQLIRLIIFFILVYSFLRGELPLAELLKFQ